MHRAHRSYSFQGYPIDSRLRGGRGALVVSLERVEALSAQTQDALHILCVSLGSGSPHMTMGALLAIVRTSGYVGQIWHVLHSSLAH